MHDTRTESPAGLPEFSRYRPRRGHPDWPRLAAEAQEIAGRVLPGLEAPRGGPAELRRKARAYGTALRNFVVNRRLAKAGREDLRPLYFIWTLLRTCNFACTYCDDHQGSRYPDLPNAGVLDPAAGLRLLEVMRTGTPAVYFAGGEPTLRKDLPALTRRARDLAFHPILINTNGSRVHRLLEQPDWRTWLADTDIVIVSVDSLDLAELRTMWGHPKPGVVLRNLLFLRHLSGPMRFKLMVNTVIQPGRTHLAREVLDLADDLGIWFCPVPMNEGPVMAGALRDDPDYRALADLIVERKRQGRRISGSTRMNRRLLDGAPLDCRNTLKPHVDFDGQLFWPCKASVNVAPERIDVLDFDSVDALYEHARERTDPTGFHGPAPEQCGGDCNWAQNYSTDAYAHGLTRPSTLLGEVAGFLRSA